MIKKIAIIIFGTFIVLIAAMIISASRHEFPSPTENWVSVTDEDKTFSILFPTNPTTTDLEVPVPETNGSVASVLYTSWSEDKSAAFAVERSIYPTAVQNELSIQSNPVMFLEEFVDDAVSSEGNNLAMKKETTFQGYPAMDFEIIKSPGATNREVSEKLLPSDFDELGLSPDAEYPVIKVRGRYVWADGVFYSLIVSSNSIDEKADLFIDSFKILKR